VAQDWEAARREELNAEYRDRLLEKYTVVIEDEPVGDSDGREEPSP
jgi:hypothetical protein